MVTVQPYGDELNDHHILVEKMLSLLRGVIDNRRRKTVRTICLILIQLCLFSQVSLFIHQNAVQIAAVFETTPSGNRGGDYELQFGDLHPNNYAGDPVMKSKHRSPPPPLHHHHNVPIEEVTATTTLPLQSKSRFPASPQRSNANHKNTSNEDATITTNTTRGNGNSDIFTPTVLTTIAYSITVTDCPAGNNTYEVIDGAAVLGHSIHLHSSRASRSKYDYKLYAFIHVDAVMCVEPLQKLGYTIKVIDPRVEDFIFLPKTTTIANSNNDDDPIPNNIRNAMEQNGCCGSKEFLKLYVYTLVDHPLAIHLDMDTLITQPLDPLFDRILNVPSSVGDHNGTTRSNGTGFAASWQPHWDDPRQQHQSDFAKEDTDWSKYSFFFTRDYHQQSSVSQNPKHYGVQGGFFIVRPNLTMFQELQRILHEDVKSLKIKRKGWNSLGYGGYWGSTQIQGYLSFVYGEYWPSQALELNRCYFNTMIADDPHYEIKEKKSKTAAHNSTSLIMKQRCRTEEPICEDCRTTDWSNIYIVHLTTCRKPWECPYLRTPTQPILCRAAHKAWFETRRQLEQTMNGAAELAKRNPNAYRKEWTLGYCSKGRTRRSPRIYHPLSLQ